MIPTDLGKTLRQMVEGLFRRGARYRAEKIGVIAAFVVLSVASALWAFSEPTDDDELGVDLETSGGMVGFEMLVENNTGDDLRDLRITLDRQYLYTTELLEAGDYVRLTAEDLDYAYYIPRSWGQQEWETLADEEDKPGAHPEGGFDPSLAQIRAREGRLDTQL